MGKRSLYRRMGFINIRAFGHAIKVTSGAYDKPDDPGEITHFQALASALSATVGLGNIAGVAIAVGVGGPGAVFWMVRRLEVTLSPSSTPSLGVMVQATTSPRSKKVPVSVGPEAELSSPPTVHP